MQILSSSFKNKRLSRTDITETDCVCGCCTDKGNVADRGKENIGFVLFDKTYLLKFVRYAVSLKSQKLWMHVFLITLQ